ncbi:uncharacterized protein PG998_006869 [Apiospora kogelbergensis]|uniref:uncharacterized protein n=1 Tax=Apiospora kogelbergensis TaxID=1337665 RepID=UPI00312CDEB7
MLYGRIYLIDRLGAVRNHHTIFVVTQQDGSGTLFHVTGDIQNGMILETKETPKIPDLSASFVSKSQSGLVRVEEVSRVDSICRANPPPAKQFNGPRRINPMQSLRRCQEWTSEAIAILRARGVLLAVNS